MKTKVSDSFWNRYKELVRTRMIPYQWNVLNDNIDITIEKERNDASIPSEKSHAIENFKIAAGRSRGEHYGWVFQDSDVYKWLEAAAFTLRDHPDEELKKITDSVVDLIAEAQEESGYLNTYYTIMEPDHKYRRLGESHELYCAGHFIEAAVAYYEITGSTKALDIAQKLADHIDSCFGPEEGKIHGMDGHEEIEIGLMKLYHLTGQERYLELSRYFLLQRGQDPEFFKRQLEEDTGKPAIGGLYNAPLSYFQIHAPLLEQDTAEGHAVRLVYMCTALADVAASTGSVELYEVCRRIWRNIADKRMFITGGIGSTVNGESFTLDYDLPNDTMYCETCASIGLIFFARQMLRISSDGEYGDVMERALYNTALAGMALDGRHFFYVNPLEVVPAKSEKDPTKSHVKIVRPDWLGCACCPPNLARLIASVEDYIYTDKGKEILVNLFIKSRMEKNFEGGKLILETDADYPRSGDISFAINNTGNKPVRIGIRIPGWAGKALGSVNGKELDVKADKGFWYVEAGAGETKVTLKLDMTPKRWYANPLVSEDVHKVCVSRGPQVFCAEGVDNGEDLHLLSLPKTSDLECTWDDELLGGVAVIEAEGIRFKDAGGSGLYRSEEAVSQEKQRIRMIPYYAWANRGRNEMRVWLYEKE
jgi:DUF1680 family protein